ncbi:NAD(P)-dependent oxidoreductase [Caballeronia glebae]|uniref:NAD(P)-dependent oxidoreductase n=1 Tax=Caballeronia glebae TaxID=1777143 RepID=UPI0038BAC1C0
MLAWTLCLQRDMPRHAAQQMQRLWKAQDYVRLARKTVGLRGLGALGEGAAQRLLQVGLNVCTLRASAS